MHDTYVTYSTYSTKIHLRSMFRRWLDHGHVSLYLPEKKVVRGLGDVGQHDGLLLPDQVSQPPRTMWAIGKYEGMRVPCCGSGVGSGQIQNYWQDPDLESLILDPDLTSSNF